MRIGYPGEFDPTFGIKSIHHNVGIGPLYCIVWLESDEQVELTGAFMDPITLEIYVKENRQRLIDNYFEKIMLK